MNSLSVYCLVLLSVVEIAAMAQQPADWRPNISEDNKAATWDATASFLSTTLMYQTEHPPARVDVDRRCQMQVVSAGSTRIAVGIQFATTLDPAIAKEVNFKRGVVVADVTPGGPAASAGLNVKDVILSIDHHGINNGDDLTNRIGSKHVGDKVNVEYMRNGKTFDTSMTVRMREDFSISSWDFTAIDPITISTRLEKASTEIHFTGKNNGPAGELIFVTRIIDNQSQATNRGQEKACMIAENNCGEIKQPLLAADSISFGDAEISKRYARALMHAALLCGGAKAVSPF